VAIRAHHIGIEASPLETATGTGTAAENTFPCWLADSSEAPFHATLFLRLNGPPATPADYHLQVEIARERWVALKGRPFPWHAHLEPDRLFLLPD
jgi:molybdate transport system permease protein